MSTVYESVKELCIRAKNAAPTLAVRSGAERNSLLCSIARGLRGAADELLFANAEDLSHAAENGVPTPMLDRLTLNAERIEGIARAIEEVASLPDPIGAGQVFTRPNGLIIRRVAVPLGVVAMIYEARPNVTADAAALCLKSGNCVVLRGGKEAICTNRALVRVIRQALTEAALPADCVGLIDDITREGTAALFEMKNYVDVLIPRGSKSLISAVARDSRIPVIETGAGNCHLYVAPSAELDMAARVALNAKMSRPSVCNAIETLLVHSAVANEFLPLFAAAAGERLEIRGDDRAQAILDCKQASEDDWDTEYDDYILAVRVVDSTDEAIAHIDRYGTRHSEAIMTSDLAEAEHFRQSVDAAAVYVNASTRFTDGGEFGLGAEIGISTQKLHARGPMGLEALTCPKYYVDGSGQVRPV